MPNIDPPWIDPMTLFDGYLRLVNIEQDARRGMALCAAVQSAVPGRTHFIDKGASKADWLEALNVTDNPSDPIVSVVPCVTADATALRWTALHFSALTRWLRQFANTDYTPGKPYVKAMLKLRKQFFNSSVGEQFTAAERDEITRRYRHSSYQTVVLHARRFTQLVVTHLHPDSPPTVLDSLTGMRPQMLACIFFVERCSDHQLFEPMCDWSTAGNEQRFGHGMQRGGLPADQHQARWLRAANRYGWRTINGHGFKPSQSFYGKTWLAQRTAPESLYAGIELEIGADRRTEQSVIAALYAVADEFGSQANERLHVERDGSITGVECPLMPHEIGSFHGETFWRKIWSAVQATPATSDDGKCGMHIHVNADTALAVPPTLAAQIRSMGVLSPFDPERFQGQCGFLISLVTEMLMGGPFLFCFKPATSGYHFSRLRELLGVNSNEEICYPQVPYEHRGLEVNENSSCPSTEDPLNLYAATYVFGRHASWDGEFARSEFSLYRKIPGINGERYRPVNFQNKDTIEYRIFGPAEFKPDDWLNVTTQIAAAITHFCRMHAHRAILKGVEHRLADHRQFLAELPQWLVPMLPVWQYVRGLTCSMEVRPRDVQQQNRRYTQINATTVSDLAFPLAIAHDSTGWLLGTVRPFLRRGEEREQRSSEAPNHYAHYCKSVLGSVTSAPFKIARRAQIYRACMLLWKGFLNFLHDNAPQYDVALNHLAPIAAQLPTDEQFHQLGAWDTLATSMMSNVVDAATPEPTGAVAYGRVASATLRGDPYPSAVRMTTTTSTSGTAWTSAFITELDTNQ